jgi:hypothetical protein
VGPLESKNVIALDVEEDIEVYCCGMCSRKLGQALIVLATLSALLAACLVEPAAHAEKPLALK